MPEKNTADIGFEKKIWDAACVLRGNIDASEYKSVVLGLIFLKYISDRFEEKYNHSRKKGMALKKILTSTHPKVSSLFLKGQGGVMLLPRRIPPKLALQ